MAEPVANSHAPIADPADWLPVDEAARLTGQSERHWRRIATKAFQRSLARLAPPPTGKGKPIWWVSRTLDPRLSRCPRSRTRSERAREALLARFPQPAVERAYRKFHWLERWRSACAVPRLAGQTEKTIAEQIAIEAKAVEGDDFRISVRSLEAWHRAISELGFDGQVRGVSALVDRYAGPGVTPRSPEAAEYFFQVYHCQARHSARTCHDATVLKAERKGWSWPAAYTATTRWLRETENKAESCLHREGRTAYSKKHMAHLQIDYTVLQPGERYVLDHTQCDFWARYRTELIRPWLTTIIDARSRVLVGWNLGVTPHQDAIIAAMRMAFRDRAIPQKVHVDQGKDFTSELITGFTKRERNRLRREHGPQWRQIVLNQVDVFWAGVLGELGIEIAEAIPYSPWSKGLKERWYRTFQDHCSKTFATYCANSPAARPEALKRILADNRDEDIPELQACHQVVADAVELYNRSEHRGLDGLSPLAVWATAERLRRAGETELLALMQSRGVYRVHANGVSLRIRSKTVTYGAATPALYRYAGRDVFITLDPDDCSGCFAYTVDRSNRSFIGRLEANEPIPANTSVEELSEAIRNVRRRRKEFEKAKREAPHRVRGAAQEVRALRREQLNRLRSTGTDDPAPDVAVVRTGFESASTPARTSVGPTPKRRRKTRDLAETAEALAFGSGLSRPVTARPHSTLDLLSTYTTPTESLQEDGDTDQGTDAGPRPDVLSLIAGDRYGPGRKQRPRV